MTEAKTGERTPVKIEITSHITGYRAACIVEYDGPSVFIGRRTEFDDYDLVALIPYEKHDAASKSEAERDAAGIVQACNAFPALVEALEPLRQLPDACVNSLINKRQIDEDGAFVSVSHQAVDEIFAAITKARSALEAAMKTEG